MNGKLEEHLQAIGDFVQIDDKIVTYKWISKTLKVHSNTAKQLLYTFNQKPGKGEILTTYVVAGELSDHSGLNYRLVRGDELEGAKQKFSKVTSIHIYSVQKGSRTSCVDLYNVDDARKLPTEDHKYCSIKPTEDIKRRDVKISPPAGAGSSAVTVKPAISQATKPVDNKNKPSDSTNHESKGASPKKPDTKKNDIKKRAAPAKGGGIGALFMKQAAKKKEDPANEDDDSEKKAKNVPLNKVQEDTTAEGTNKPAVNGKAMETDTVKTPTSKSKSQPKKKRKKSNGSEDSAAKRRKRIQIASDSESSEESESNGDERYESPEPEPEAPTIIESDEDEIIPATPVGRKRVKKLVDRTYEDDEGYIITKKEYVFESCSDDDIEPPNKITSSGLAKVAASSIAEEKSVKEPQKQTTSEAKKRNQKNDPQTSGDGKKPEAKKPGRPPSKAKPTGSSSPKKQVSIMTFFKKK